jgi:DNA mismatch endonuclease (patch repair protein)
VERDRKAQQKLREAGWTVLIVWECQTKKTESLVRELELIRLNRDENR